jgi:O-antigen/teichoic acid export membrane protein
MKLNNKDDWKEVYFYVSLINFGGLAFLLVNILLLLQYDFITELIAHVITITNMLISLIAWFILGCAYFFKFYKFVKPIEKGDL